MAPTLRRREHETSSLSRRIKLENVGRIAKRKDLKVTHPAIYYSHKLAMAILERRYGRKYRKRVELKRAKKNMKMKRACYCKTCPDDEPAAAAATASAGLSRCPFHGHQKNRRHQQRRRDRVLQKERALESVRSISKRRDDSTPENPDKKFILVFKFAKLDSSSKQDDDRKDMIDHEINERPVITAMTTSSSSSSSSSSMAAAKNGTENQKEIGGLIPSSLKPPPPPPRLGSDHWRMGKRELKKSRFFHEHQRNLLEEGGRDLQRSQGPSDGRR